jgi:hypothetical protein
MATKAPTKTELANGKKDAEISSTVANANANLGATGITTHTQAGTVTTLPTPTPTPVPQPTTNTNTESGITTTTTTDPDGSSSTTSAMNFSTASSIIDSALTAVGLDPNQVATAGANTGQTLTQYFWQQITTQGLTDPTTIGDMISTLLPSTGQFQTAFPGYAAALKEGYVQTVAQYVSAEESATQTMLNYGVPVSLINPTTVGNLIAGGVSNQELTDRLQDGFDAVTNAPAEVQNYFSQEFGVNGPSALATLFLTPAEQGGQTWPTLEKMLAGAEIGGAAEASNLTVSQGLAQRLADMGQTYSSAQSKFQTLTAQQGLYEANAGEANKATVPGTANANQPLNESTTGVEAAFGLSANAQQQVENEELSRQNEFKGGGGATTSEAEGYQGIGHAEAF